MSNEEWYQWQRQIIRSDEYKDIIPARNNAQQQFDKTVKESLPKVKRND